MIKDSGNREQFYDVKGNPMGVRDIQEGKGRCDLLPLDIIIEIMPHTKDCHTVIEDIYSFTITGDCKHLKNALAWFCQIHHPTWDMYTMILEVSKHFEEGAKKYSENNWMLGIPVKNYVNSGIRHYLKYLRCDADEPHDRAFCWNLICAMWTCTHKPELNDYKQNQEDLIQIQFEI